MSMDPKVFELTFKHELYLESVETDRNILEQMKRRIEMCSLDNNELSISDIEIIKESISTILKNMRRRNKLIEPLVDYIQEKEFSSWFNKSNRIN